MEEGSCNKESVVAGQVSLHRYFHGIILKEFLVEMEVEPSKENIEKIKQTFKDYLRIASVSALENKVYGQAVAAVIMLMAREFGVETPVSFKEKTMKQILKEVNDGF